MRIIGVGAVANRQEEVINGPKGLELVAVADTNEKALSRFARHLRVARTYNDYRAFLNNKRLETVAICVPHNLLQEIAIRAVEIEKHVVLEKRIASSVRETVPIIRGFSSSLGNFSKKMRSP